MKEAVEPKVVYIPPPCKYVVQLRSEITDWENDRGYRNLYQAEEAADLAASEYLNLQVRVIEL